MNRHLWLLLGAMGCAPVAAVLDPPLAQLNRWNHAPPAEIAAEPVVSPCDAANPACRRLHGLRAAACMEQAMAARAPRAACPGLSARPMLDCAAGGYEQARAGDASAVLAANHTQALICLGWLSAPDEAARLSRAALSAAAGAGPDRAPLLTLRARELGEAR